MATNTVLMIFKNNAFGLEIYLLQHSLKETETLKLSNEVENNKIFRFVVVVILPRGRGNEICGESDRPILTRHILFPRVDLRLQGQCSNKSRSFHSQSLVSQLSIKNGI